MNMPHEHVQRPEVPTGTLSLDETLDGEVG
jgi:hypothetical protein